MKNDLDRVGVGSHNNELSFSTIQCFCGLISSFLQLFVRGSLLEKLDNLCRELRAGQGIGLWINFFCLEKER